MVLADGAGAPLGVYVEAASPAEVTLLPDTLNQLADNVEVADLQGWPERLIADRGYDSNPARKLLEDCEMEPIIPARKNNRRATHQDGRKLRRYKSCAATRNVGSLNGRMHGCRTSDDWWCAMREKSATLRH
jgi:IS5 family transposase